MATLHHQITKLQIPNQETIATGWKLQTEQKIRKLRERKERDREK
jgi:hypothetical protein